jgi:hypothetical protein
MLLQELLVSLRVNQLGIARRRSFWRLLRSQRSRASDRAQQNKRSS